MNRSGILEEVKKILKIWQLELNLEYENPEKNVKVSFGDIGSFGELLAISFNPGFIGSGSGGMGFDLLNLQTNKAIECKMCSTIQNAKCNNCGLKFNDLFLSKCPKCNSQDFKKMNDSRFSINAAELLRQYESGILEKLTLCHLSLKSQNTNNKTIDILLEWFDVSFEDDEVREIKLQYFINQSTKGKKTTANLLPNSYDFFKAQHLYTILNF